MARGRCLTLDGANQAREELHQRGRSGDRIGKWRPISQVHRFTHGDAEIRIGCRACRIFEKPMDDHHRDEYVRIENCRPGEPAGGEHRVRIEHSPVERLDEGQNQAQTNERQGRLAPIFSLRFDHLHGREYNNRTQTLPEILAF